MISLTDTTTTVILPADLWWADEIAWAPVEQSAEYSLGGALVVEEAVKLAGRPITLAGHERRAWVRRSTVLALHSLAAVPGKQMVLTLADRTFNVIFRRSDGPPIEAESLTMMSPPEDDDWYTLTLRLMEI